MVSSTPRILVAVLLAQVVPGLAVAQTSHDPVSLLRQAEEAEQGLEFSQAAELYRAVVRESPGSRAARRAASRMRWLIEHADDDGGYQDLSALVRMRRAQEDRPALERFETLARRMRHGPVRREAFFLLGEAWFRRMGEPGRAVPLYREVIADPLVLEQDKRLARVALAEAQVAEGDPETALTGLVAAGLGRTFEAQSIRTALRRETHRVVAVALLILCGLVILGLGRPFRAKRAGLRSALSPARVVAVLYVVAVPGVVAELFESGAGDTFLWFAAGAVPVLLLSVLAGESMRRRRTSTPRRFAVLLGLLAAHVGVAYLALSAGGGLGSFGL